MDLEQRYTEEMSLNEDVPYFEVDDWFVLKLKDYPRDIGIDIATQVENSIDTLPKKLGTNQYIAGVSNKEDEAVYFEIEYLNQPDDTVYFMDIHHIGVDEYLDYINLNQYFKL